MHGSGAPHHHGLANNVFVRMRTMMICSSSCRQRPLIGSKLHVQDKFIAVCACGAEPSKQLLTSSFLIGFTRQHSDANNVQLLLQIVRNWGRLAIVINFIAVCKFAIREKYIPTTNVHLATLIHSRRGPSCTLVLIPLCIFVNLTHIASCYHKKFQ